MKTMEIKKALGLDVCTHEMLAGLLAPRFANVNEKIAALVKNGDLTRLKRGVYAFSPLYQSGPIDPVAVANMLYAPSYVSFEYALSLHGLIPERVDEITSATSAQPKAFQTPLGRFSYRRIPPKAYALGVDWLYDDQSGGRFLATPEKALCDKIRYDRGIGTLTLQKMSAYLRHDLRIDPGISLDAGLIDTIAEAYRSHNLKTLARLLRKGVAA